MHNVTYVGKFCLNTVFLPLDTLSPTTPPQKETFRRYQHYLITINFRIEAGFRMQVGVLIEAGV